MHRQITAGGRSLLRSAPWLAALSVCWLLVQTGSPLRASVSHGSASVTVGIDADPTGNTATTLGSIESCRSVINGATFTVDFWVKDIPSPGIEGFQGDLGYAPTRLNVTGYNVGMLLAANSGSSVTDFTRTAVGDPDHLPDADGKFTPAAFDFGTVPGHTETGSGVLVRITLKAIANGTSPLTLTKVKLSDPANPPNPIGDTNGDNIFDGSISNAEIRIGEPCPTPAPTPTPTRTPTPTATGVAHPVGGTAERPDLTETSYGESGRSAAGYASTAAGVAAVVVTAGIAAWYVRRRWRSWPR